MELTEDQKKAIEGISNWFMSELPKTRIYSVSGSAGTGKTTVIKYVIENLGIGNKVALCAYTGKASLILREKSDTQTSTIHRLIYNVQKDKNEKIHFLLKSREELQSQYKLIIVDESSMVSTQILEDLLSFEIPILFIGDKNQLPPIGESESIFENANINLKTLTRFAAENPIYQLSQKVLRREKIKYGKYSDNVIVIKDIPKDRYNILLSADQVLCGTNKKRNYLNHYIRSLKGINDTLPIIGDKMVCRKNSWDNYLEQSNLFLVNGLMGEITSQPDQENFTYFDRTLNRSRFDTIFRFDFTPQNTDEFYESLKWDYDSIMDGTNNMDKKNGMGDVGVNICNYGYAITVHVSQGSEYNKVVFFGNELFGDEENRNRLLYTGITRAKEKLILVL